MNQEHQNLQTVCTNFNIGTLEKYERLAEGVLNLNYKLYTNTGVYFTKGIRSKKQDSLGLIYQVEKLMKEAGIPSIAMMTTQTGECTTDVDDQKFTVYPFIESDRSHSYSIEDYYRMGEVLARIHKVTENSIPSDFNLKTVKNNDHVETIETLNSYKERILTKVEQDETDVLFLEYINLKLEILNTMEDSLEIFSHKQHILHGDYHAGNLLLDKDSREIVGVCDWEKTESGSRAYEIARSAILLFEDPVHEIEQMKAYVRGYVSVYPISREELINGFTFRAKSMVKSKWMEDLYYNNGDTRSNKFVSKDIDRIHFFTPIILNKNNVEFFDLFLE